MRRRRGIKGVWSFERSSINKSIHLYNMVWRLQIAPKVKVEIDVVALKAWCSDSKLSGLLPPGRHRPFLFFGVGRAPSVHERPDAHAACGAGHGSRLA